MVAPSHDRVPSLKRVSTSSNSEQLDHTLPTTSIVEHRDYRTELDPKGRRCAKVSNVER